MSGGGGGGVEKKKKIRRIILQNFMFSSCFMLFPNRNILKTFKKNKKLV